MIFLGRVSEAFFFFLILINLTVVQFRFYTRTYYNNILVEPLQR